MDCTVSNSTAHFMSVNRKVLLKLVINKIDLDETQRATQQSVLCASQREGPGFDPEADRGVFSLYVCVAFHGAPVSPTTKNMCDR